MSANRTNYYKLGLYETRQESEELSSISAFSCILATSGKRHLKAYDLNSTNDAVHFYAHRMAEYL